VNLTRACLIALILVGSLFVGACTDSGDNANDLADSNAKPPATGTPAGPAAPANAARNAATPAAPAAVVHNYGGSVDRVECEAVSGWVWDSANPNADLKVDVFIDNKLAESIPAKNPRPDLKKAGLGTGNYGYSFKVPDTVKDGKPHAVSVKVAGSDYALKVYEQTKPTLTCAR
ncbi:MAG: hypothetical protein M3348_10000, partial [Acidobacteriota bacterium]|nr:hypothetical protein [Acidobacteriota bacterium]